MRLTLTLMENAVVKREYRDLVGLELNCSSMNRLHYVIMGPKAARQLARMLVRVAESAERHAPGKARSKS